MFFFFHFSNLPSLIAFCLRLIMFRWRASSFKYETRLIISAIYHFVNESLAFLLPSQTQVIARTKGDFRIDLASDKFAWALNDEGQQFEHEKKLFHKILCSLLKCFRCAKILNICAIAQPSIAKSVQEFQARIFHIKTRERREINFFLATIKCFLFSFSGERNL